MHTATLDAIAGRALDFLGRGMVFFNLGVDQLFPYFS
jgi:hypothetical protein